MSQQPQDGRGGRSTSTRREFAKTLAALAATPLFSSFATKRASANSAMREDADSMQDREAAPTPDAETLTQLVRIRYGSNLSDEQMAEVRRSIENRLRNTAAIRKFQLANGDEPAFVFSASQK
jgi:hypothetical protein